ncbi:MAG: amine dehydrogenase [Burkholderiales bacterium]|nr:amine dehydrogenase [Burkholderiales bacterium]
MKRIQEWVDRFAERRARDAAQRTGRRSTLAKLGAVMVGAAALPMLPFDRSGRAHAAVPTGEDESGCDYWRNCALDGFLCSCCGGTINACPPGTEVSKVTWVGTCASPKDGKNYLVSYNDCCGKVACGRCLCNYNERERPAYRMGVHNDINWCMANTATMYHCTVSAIVGQA